MLRVWLGGTLENGKWKGIEKYNLDVHVFCGNIYVKGEHRAISNNACRLRGYQTARRRLIAKVKREARCRMIKEAAAEAGKKLADAIRK